jgi:hypothetical protein
MRHAVLGAFGALVMLLVAATGATAAGAQDGGAQGPPAPSVALLHGLPGVVADVTVAGQVVVPNFQPGQIQDLSAFAGQTLRDVSVRAAGSDQVLIGPIDALAVPAAGNVTIVAHPRDDGTPTLSTFENDVTAIPAGQARLTIRHVAGLPAANLLVGPTMPFVDMTNGGQVSALLPAGPVTQVSLLPAGAPAPIALPDLTLRAGEHLVVYATGTLSQGTVTAYAQSLGGLGGTPTRVNTGDGVLGEARGGGSRALPPFDVTALVLVGTVLGATGARVALDRAERS